MKYIESYLPIFTGFYGSFLDPNENYQIESEIEYINELRQEKNKKPINYDNLKIDYDNLYNDLSSELCNIVYDLLKDFIYDIKYKSLQRPKYYNYSNDKIKILIKPNKNKILKYITKNFENWDKYLKENFTSYDGFYSFYSNNPNSNDWNVKNIFKDIQLQSVLNFIAENENILENELLENEIYISEYIINFEELTE